MNVWMEAGPRVFRKVESRCFSENFFSFYHSLSELSQSLNELVINSLVPRKHSECGDIEKMKEAFNTWQRNEVIQWRRVHHHSVQKAIFVVIKMSGVYLETERESQSLTLSDFHFKNKQIPQKKPNKSLAKITVIQSNIYCNWNVG